MRPNSADFIARYFNQRNTQIEVRLTPASSAEIANKLAVATRKEARCEQDKGSDLLVRLKPIITNTTIESRSFAWQDPSIHRRIQRQM